MRALLTGLTALVGLGMSAASFVVRLRQSTLGWPEAAAPPTGASGEILYLPVLFILGVMLMFLSAVVYELVPDR